MASTDTTWRTAPGKRKGSKLCPKKAENQKKYILKEVQKYTVFTRGEQCEGWHLCGSRNEGK